MIRRRNPGCTGRYLHRNNSSRLTESDRSGVLNRDIKCCPLEHAQRYVLIRPDSFPYETDPLT